MAPDAPDQGFRVSDRRRRDDDEPPEGRESASPAETRREPSPDAPEGERTRDLTGLFVMFASSALIALGESPDPLTGQVSKDLDQATEAIDVLMLLREKTQGNRTPPEDQLLEQILHDLQLRFVRATRAPQSG